MLAKDNERLSGENHALLVNQSALCSAALQADFDDKLRLMNEIISRKEREIFSANASVANKDSIIDEMTEKISALLGQLDEMEAKLAILKNDATTRDAAIHTLKQELSHAHAQLAYISESAGSLHSRLDASVAASVNEIAAMRFENDSLRVALSQMDQRSSILRSIGAYSKYDVQIMLHRLKALNSVLYSRMKADYGNVGNVDYSSTVLSNLVKRIEHVASLCDQHVIKFTVEVALNPMIVASEFGATDWYNLYEIDPARVKPMYTLYPISHESSILSDSLATETVRDVICSFIKYYSDASMVPRTIYLTDRA